MKRSLLIALSFLPMFAMAEVLGDSAKLEETKRELSQIESNLDKCLQSDEGMSNMGMKMCVGDAHSAADKVLNQVYQSVTAGLKKENSEESQEILRRLVAAQRAWIVYRDANSNLHGISMLNGSGEGLEIVGQLYHMTKERTLELSKLLQ